MLDCGHEKHDFPFKAETCEEFAKTVRAVGACFECSSTVSCDHRKVLTATEILLDNRKRLDEAEISHEERSKTIQAQAEAIQVLTERVKELELAASRSGWPVSG